MAQENQRWASQLNSLDERQIKVASWIIGRRRIVEARQKLWDLVTAENSLDISTRQVCLKAWSEVVPIEEALRVINWSEVTEIDPSLPSILLNNPLWIDNGDWQDALMRQSALASETARTAQCILGWQNCDVTAITWPVEAFIRFNVDPRNIDWQIVIEEGYTLLTEQNPAPWLGLWQQHAAEWARNWYRAQRALALYERSREDENQLRQWLDSATNEAQPALEPVTWISLPDTMRSYSALAMVSLGLHRLSGQPLNHAFRAWWDGVLCSWSASLQYTLYETYTNLQITQWHIGALIGRIAQQNL